MYIVRVTGIREWGKTNILYIHTHIHIQVFNSGARLIYTSSDQMFILSGRLYIV